MYYTNNPLADFHRYDSDMQDEFDKLPECAECGCKIQDDYCYEIEDEYICEECLNNYHRKAVEDICE